MNLMKKVSESSKCALLRAPKSCRPYPPTCCGWAETERAALAKELHDELGGLITAAKMDLSWLSARLGGSLDAECRDKLDSVMQMLNQAMMLKRRVVENLRPSLLDHFGLAVALRSHFDEHCQRAGIECVATLPEEVLALDPVAQLTLFRVAQEALANIIARGGAKHIEVVIEPEGEGYVLAGGRRWPEHGHRSRALHAECASPHVCGRRQCGSGSAARSGQSDQGFRPAICSSIGMS